MIRAAYIERIIRKVYGGQPTDDSEITPNLVNSYLNDAIAAAAKQNYVESIKLDGVAYVNNSFSSTFSGLAITSDDTNNLGYKVTLPQVPVALGKNEGINTLRFKDSEGFISQSVIWLSENQAGYADQMRIIPNKIYAYHEGKIVRMTSTLPLYSYTATVSMVSGGDATNLNSELNFPDDWFPFVDEYVFKALATERNMPKDAANDGVDIK